jgi:outer membrane protein assembly factor BamB
MMPALFWIPSLLLATAEPSEAKPMPLEWGQFRGPSASGIAANATPPATFAPGKNQLWKRDCPSGFSSPIVVRDRIVLTAYDQEKLWTIAYACKDGQELWRREAPTTAIERFHKVEGSPASATPTSDGQVIVSYFGSCGLWAYNLDGKEIWHHPMPTARTNNDFGSGTSPVLHRGVVYLQRDLEQNASLMAFDAATGQRLWQTNRDGFTTNWGSPLVRDTSTGVELVAPAGLKLTAYDAKTGEQKWIVPNLAAVNCTTPITIGDDILYSSWSPSGGSDFKMPRFDDILKPEIDTNNDGQLSEDESQKTFLKNFFSTHDTNRDGQITRAEWDAKAAEIRAGKNGTVRVTSKGVVRWFAPEGSPYVPNPLITPAGIFLINHRGRATLLDPQTGKSRYELENLGISAMYASPVLAAGRIYLFSLDGQLLILNADAADAPEVLSKAKFGERIAATPALSGSRLYLRTATALYAFDSEPNHPTP